MNTDGRQAAFLAQLQPNQRIVYKIAAAYGRTAADRDDLVAEMTAALWKSFARYDDRYRFSTWAYRICLNVAISFVRAERRRAERRSAIDPATLEIADTPEALDDAVTALRAHVASLGDIDKALMLLYLDEHDYKSIAAILGLTETNVATKLSRLRARAKAALGGNSAREGEDRGTR